MSTASSELSQESTLAAASHESDSTGQEPRTAAFHTLNHNSIDAMTDAAAVLNRVVPNLKAIFERDPFNRTLPTLIQQTVAAIDEIHKEGQATDFAIDSKPEESTAVGDSEGEVINSEVDSHFQHHISTMSDNELLKGFMEARNSQCGVTSIAERDMVIEKERLRAIEIEETTKEELLKAAAILFPSDEKPVPGVTNRQGPSPELRYDALPALVVSENIANAIQEWETEKTHWYFDAWTRTSRGKHCLGSRVALFKQSGEYVRWPCPMKESAPMGTRGYWSKGEDYTLVRILGEDGWKDVRMDTVTETSDDVPGTADGLEDWVVDTTAVVGTQEWMKNSVA